MAINRAFVGSQDISTVTNATIQIVLDRPDTTTLIDPPETPQRLVGYYNPSLQGVELYVVDRSGLRWMRI
jgi:hypothetical protein